MWAWTIRRVLTTCVVVTLALPLLGQGFETRITGTGVRQPPATGADNSKKISTGTFYISPVGFDANHTHAIAYENYLCGNLCGWGAYHLLVKNAGRWEEAKDVNACTWHY